ncbi:hypothetical protein BABINDRAFT_162798 [Babjeviella inositovora NRRL Y-12698]|uniref:SIS domain-containing protein n=1 Tax=Babjeviella inositovora NRRL Y-12698 TaxID=984486 RepID=A0A1E3QLN4_9ASCO|nr:uncharacterized protein BABINDRAFT_162798 [Babjeviella inositovora NRRL Y-12698]ODQ78595.1 hypothetical protein BABINDRAFT_162798 [Babjeviella inositovora NRRL Y-12698]
MNSSPELLQNALSTVSTVLYTQNLAVNHLVNQFSTSAFARANMQKSLEIMNTSLHSRGKIVITGIGKSHKIASKVVATMNSLSLHAALLHPSEALHGDLGVIRADHGDCLVLITASGNTPELLQLLPHVPVSVPVILLSNKKLSKLSQHPQVQSMLYAELPKEFSEETIYGLAAPTISTTLCLLLADAACMALVDLHINRLSDRQRLFGERHPGGAIGAAYTHTQVMSSLNSSTQSSTVGLSFGSFILGNSLTSMDENTEAPEVLKNAFNWPEQASIPSSDEEYELEVSSQKKLAEGVDLKLKSNKNRVKTLQEPMDFASPMEIFSTIAMYDTVVVIQNGQRRGIATQAIQHITRAVFEDDGFENQTLWKLVSEHVDAAMTAC